MIVLQVFGSKEEGSLSRLPIDGMLAVFAKEQGGPPDDVLGQWSLGAIIGESVSESFLHRESRARAERNAKAAR